MWFFSAIPVQPLNIWSWRVLHHKDETFVLAQTESFDVVDDSHSRVKSTKSLPKTLRLMPVYVKKKML